MKYLIACAGLLIVSAPAQAESPQADAVYKNGKIYTVDPAHPWAQAVAIKDGKFLFVGTDKGVAAYIGPKTDVVDLGKKMAMPGLHDAHQHLVKAEQRHIYCAISPDSNVEQIIATLKACPKEKRLGDWIIADVYRGDKFPGGQANKKYIDAAFPDTPVYIREWSYHHGLANSKALQIAGVDRNTPDPEGGRIVRDENGEPTGEFLTKATWLITQHIPPLPASTLESALLRSADICAQYGITSAQEASASRAGIAMIKKLDDEGRWHLRVASHIVWGNPASAVASPSEMEATVLDRAKYRSAHQFTDFVKIYIDGSPMQPHATDVQLDEHDQVDVRRLYMKPEDLNAALVRFDKMGIKVKMHAVGTGATRTALNAIAAARAANGDSGILHDIAHSLRYSAADIGRPQGLGAVMEMSPAIWQIKGPLTQNVANAWQFKSHLKRGTLMTIGSDWVVLPNPNLFPGIAGMADHGKESIPLKEAVKIATINGARSVGWDKINGSITVGKLANMIVLDRNIFKIPNASVADTKVLTTIFEGKPIYQAASAAPENP